MRPQLLKTASYVLALLGLSSFALYGADKSYKLEKRLVALESMQRIAVQKSRDDTNLLNQADVRLEVLERIVRGAGIDGFDISSTVMTNVSLVASIDLRLAEAESRLHRLTVESVDYGQVSGLHGEIEKAVKVAAERSDSIEWSLKGDVRSLAQRLERIERILR